MNKWSSFWSIAGPIVSIPAAIYFTILVVVMFGRNDYELEVVGSEESLVYPDSVQMMISDYYINQYRSTSDSAYWIMAELRTSKSAEFFRKLTHLFIVTIENVGSKNCSDVQFYAAKTGYCSISGPGLNKNMKFNGAINLGSLQPTESVKIFVWTSFFEKLDLDEMRVTHSNGFEEVEFEKEVRGILAFVAEYWIVMLGFLPLLIYSGMLISTGIRQMVKNSTATS